MKKLIATITFSLVALSSALALQHEHHHDESDDVTITGEVVDTVCYVSHGSRGEEHIPCAKYCAEQGISLGILDEKTDKVYISMPVDHSNPNAKLVGFIAQRVKVTGTLYHKGGLTGIYVKKVEPAEK